MNRIHFYSAVLALAGVLLGCSGSPSEQSTITTGSSQVQGRDSCELLTLADVQEVYGNDMTPSDLNRAASGRGADLSTCTYANDRMPMSAATLMVVWPKGAGNPLADRDGYIDQLRSELPEDVEIEMEKAEFQGLPAIWQPELGSLIVFKDGAQATVTADASPGNDVRGTVEVLMAKVVARL